MSVSPATFARFVAVVGAQLGLRIDDRASEALERRAAARHDSPAAYVDRMAGGGDPGELAALATELTVGETYFFRHREQMRAFAEVALPARLAARGLQRHVWILSAGCSSGDEAYSLAILARERAALDAGWQIHVEAIDVNPVALAKAGRARYSRWALRDTPAELEQRYFVTEGNEVVLVPEIARAVVFEPRNLASDAGWPRQRYDVVFCRNVLMYFTDDQAAAALDRIARALVPGGFLFLGHAESLRDRSHHFALRQSHGTFYYERAATLAEGPVVHAAVAATAMVGASGSTAWMDAIAQASARIEQMASAAMAGAAETDTDTDTDTDTEIETVLAVIDPRPTIEAVRRALRDERFAEALAALDALPAEVTGTPDLMLLRAVVLTQQGDRRTAEAACRALLAVQPADAGAHYLLAIGREGVGDAIGAGAHALRATELDPGFAMPYVHLGLLARRAGDRAGAVRSLVRAIALLAEEDPGRIALFGGGFGRDALTRLCRAELAAAGGAA